MDTKTKENAILRMQKKYSPSELVSIDCLIRELACTHYKYGKNMPLCIGKARGIHNIMEIFYNTEATFEYVWIIFEDFNNEPGGGWKDDD